MKYPAFRSFTFASLAWALSACGSAPPEPAPIPPESPVVATADPVRPQELPSQPVEEPTPQPSPEPVDLVAVEMAAYQAAKPVFEENCESCHLVTLGKKASKGAKHFAMGSYPFGGHHASELSTTIRTSLGTTGKPATMPKDDPGAVQGEELKLVLAWADAFDEAAAAKVGHHGEHGDGHHGDKHKHEHKKPKKRQRKQPKKKHDHADGHHSHKH